MQKSGSQGDMSLTPQAGRGSQWHQAHAQIVDTPTVEGKPHGGALSRPGEMGALCVPWIPDLAVAKKVVIAR
jgi:hypothetical protein